jgi:hypothetical protein
MTDYLEKVHALIFFFLCQGLEGLESNIYEVTG